MGGKPGLAMKTPDFIRPYGAQRGLGAFCESSMQGEVDLQLICMFQKLVLAHAHERFIVAASERSQDAEKSGDAKGPSTRA